MKNTNAIFLLLLAISISSCSSLSSISNGAYSDISLNRDSNEYELKRLNEIEAQGSAFIGIPTRTEKRKGVVVRFNGVDIGRSNQVAPILTMLAYTIGTGFLINDIVGTKSNGDDKLGLPLASIIALPVAGVLNNFTWGKASLKNASWEVNRRLVEENPEVDVFLNPKYEIEYTQGLFTQKAKVKAKEIVDAFEISRASLVDNNQVYIVEDSMLVLKSITTEYFSQTTAVITGLTNGQQVLTKVPPAAFDGMKVIVYKGKN